MQNSQSVSYFLRQISRTSRPTWTDEQAQVALAGSGHRGAIELVVSSHLAFVVHVAKEFRSRGVPLEDLIAEGCVGLVKAIRGYKSASGTRFTTYASFWIRKEILSAVSDQPHAIHVPRYAREHGHDTIRPLRLDAPAREGGGSALADRLRHPDPLPAAAIIAGEQKDQVRRQVMRLPLRDRAVIVWRYGLGGLPPQTLHQIADRLGVSKERVRQIEVAALTRLRVSLGSRGGRFDSCRSAGRSRAPSTPNAALQVELG